MPLHVELVSADQLVWSGDASMVVARTTDGEIGVLTGHSPVLGVLVGGQVRITPVEGAAITAEVGGGFFSVDHDRVTVVAESAHLASVAPAR